AQAAALEGVLNGEEAPCAPGGPGDSGVRDPEAIERVRPRSGFRVAVGMRHAPPFIADGLAGLARAGARRIIAVILSPQYSPGIMGGYHRALDAARSEHADVQVAIAGAWYDVPEFVDALAGRLRDALGQVARPERESVPVLFTAHSLPRSIAESEPAYLDQLRDTAALVAAHAGLSTDRWRFAYQSAGHTPEPWLTPDLKDVFPLLRAAGHRTAVVAPIQFLADHLEVLYDLDVAAREQARDAGIQFVRPESLNTMPLFIRALACVVFRELEGMSQRADALARKGYG